MRMGRGILGMNLVLDAVIGTAVSRFLFFYFLVAMHLFSARRWWRVLVQLRMAGSLVGCRLLDRSVFVEKQCTFICVPDEFAR